MLESRSFFRMNQEAGCACTVGEMNAMLTLERDRFGGGCSAMVWAAIAHGYRSPLVVIDGNLNAQRYRDDILAHHVISLFDNNAKISIFQHDKTTSQTTRDAVKCFRTNNIDFIDDWPASRLRRRPNPPANVIELRQAFIQEWNNIPQADINTLVNSMHRRCTAVVNSRGGHTRY